MILCTRKFSFALQLAAADTLLKSRKRRVAGPKVDMVLNRTGTTAERHERELRNLKNFFPALLPSASEEPLPS
jgi:hypothetical protein